MNMEVRVVSPDSEVCLFSEEEWTSASNPPELDGIYHVLVGHYDHKGRFYGYRQYNNVKYLMTENVLFISVWKWVFEKDFAFDRRFHKVEFWKNADNS